jgi:hypothetical protein
VFPVPSMRRAHGHLRRSPWAQRRSDPPRVQWGARFCRQRLLGGLVVTVVQSGCLGLVTTAASTSRDTFGSFSRSSSSSPTRCCGPRIMRDTSLTLR